MAIPSSSVWEVRDTGASDNGGLFNSARGGVDYSQQDAAQATFTNLSSSGITVTDDDGGGSFTAQMVGNGFCISGVWYEIVTYTNADVVDVDRALVVSGASGKVGGAVDNPETIDGAEVAGNTIYIKKGSSAYALSGAVSTVAGTLALPVKWIGYNSSRGDDPQPGSGNQPSIDTGTNGLSYQNYNKVFYIDFDTEAPSGVLFYIGAVAYKCKFHNTSGTAARRAITLQGNLAAAIGNEIISDNGTGLDGAGLGVIAINNYIHDCDDYGIFFSGLTYYCVMFNIVETCTLDAIVAGNGGVIAFNTVDGNSADGIQLNAAFNVIMNNQLTNNVGYGVVDSSANLASFLQANNFYLNTAGTSNNVEEGSAKTTNDPGYADRANGDFSDVDDADGEGITEGVG
ncbi:MAG: right-handed parallel beta-helix repeat-containing protein [Candidatus Thorarchaeota archaeon]|jgi:hypothetical protein